MDRIKTEPNLEAEVSSITSPDEEKCIDIKQEVYCLPVQSSFVNNEVTEESQDGFTVKKELKEETTNNDSSVEQLASHEDGDNSGSRSKYLNQSSYGQQEDAEKKSGIGNDNCFDILSEAIPCGIHKINPLEITGIFSRKEHSENAKCILKGILIYRCGFCNKVFSLIQDLEVRMLTHGGNKPYKCEICNKHFTQSTYLTMHMRRHTGQKPFQCEVCNKYFSVKHNLAAHQVIHFGKKLYACDICKKSFLRRQHLKLHTCIHTGENPYKCKICNKGFARNCGLQYHKRTHLEKKENNKVTG